VPSTAKKSDQSSKYLSNVVECPEPKTKEVPPVLDKRKLALLWLLLVRCLLLVAVVAQWIGFYRLQSYIATSRAKVRALCDDISLKQPAQPPVAVVLQ
jgi:hypothetical protein